MNFTNHTYSKAISAMIGVAFVFFMIGMSACDKRFDDTLRAKWQLRERVANGVSVKDDSTFYNFQSAIFYFQVLKGAGRQTTGYATFEQHADTLIIDIIDDNYATKRNLDLLQWDNRKMTFVIRKLTHSAMELEDRGTLYRFRSY